MAKPPDRYIPALGYSWLTGLYDPIVRLTTRETRFKAALLQEAGLRAGERVLDLGCGTGTLAVQAKMLVPEIEMVGVDGDPAILMRARAKAQLAGVNIDFDQAFSQELPYPNDGFDCVLSSLFFHHLTLDSKKATFREISRVLKPGGRVHIADWGRPSNLLMRVAYLGIQLLDGFETTADNMRGRLPQLMADVGLVAVRESQRFATVFGTMTLYRAQKP
ncbi:MAG: class I SAM-dependent methyltransferase [Nevskiales bacterium]